MIDLQVDSAQVQPSGAVLIDLFERLASNKEIFFYHVRTVGDVMKTDFDPVNLDTVLKDTWEKMTEVGVKDMPVIEVDVKTNELIWVGTVQKTELATLFSRFVGALSQPASDDRALKVRLSNANVTDRTIPSVRPSTPLLDAVTTMVEKDVESLAVTDEDKNFIGVLSVIEILKCFEYMALIRKARIDEKPQELRIVDLFAGQGQTMPTDKMFESFVGTVKEVMRESVPTITNVASIGDAVRLMNKTQRQTIVVIDSEGRIKGTVTANEIQLALPPIVNRLERRQVQARGEMFKMNPEASDVRATLAEKVGSVTMSTPIVVTTETSVMDVATKLLEPNASDMPVTTPDGSRIAGIIGRVDLLKAFGALGGLAKKRGLLDE